MIRTEEFLGLNDFVWFIGVVEDRMDPLRLGRVRVRVHGWHSSDTSTLPTTQLPWAQPIQPITSAALGGIGTSPTGMLEGTWVVGFFMDGKRAQFPMVLGTIAGITNGEPDVSREARADLAFQPTRDDSQIVGVFKSGDDAGATPAYPYNHVVRTESGHVFEVDDTPNSERLLRRHMVGTYEEIAPDGTRRTYIVRDDYRVVAGDDFITITGDATISISGSCSVSVHGQCHLTAESVIVSSESVDLGSVGGKAVARIGDEVTVNGVIGEITSGSETVRASD